jgi:hypothetical protein
MALFAEALITRIPRRLWDVKTGRPASRSDVVEAIAVCERSIALANAAGRPQHPAIAHILIHALEMSNEPERAMASADTLATLGRRAAPSDPPRRSIDLLEERVLPAEVELKAGKIRLLATCLVFVGSRHV